MTASTFTDFAGVGKHIHSEQGYRVIARGYAHYPAASASDAAIYENSTSTFNATNSGKGFFWLDPADYAATDKTTYFRIRLTVLTNDVAPAANFTASLVPASGTPSGAVAADVKLQKGADVSGSSVAVTAPAVNTINKVDSADFTVSSASMYALRHILSATMTALSGASVRVELFVRNV
jgi:zona occludens toxin (predicted ATPase)